MCFTVTFSWSCSLFPIATRFLRSQLILINILDAPTFVWNSPENPEAAQGNEHMQTINLINTCRDSGCHDIVHLTRALEVSPFVLVQRGAYILMLQTAWHPSMCSFWISWHHLLQIGSGQPNCVHLSRPVICCPLTTPIVTIMSSLERLQSATTFQSSTDTFDFVTAAPSVPQVDPTLMPHISAFYIINKVLDYAHKYGWIELSHNFRFINLGKGGAAHGRRPRTDECRIRAGRSTRISLRYPGIFALWFHDMWLMFVWDLQSVHMIWTLTSPQRNGAFKKHILMHEYFTRGGTGRRASRDPR